MIANRHIRHDWQTWVDWEQKSVRTVCGVTTRRHLAGIPGITDQPEFVDVGGRTKWGWCSSCVYKTYGFAKVTLSRQDNMNPEVEGLYTALLETLSSQYGWILEAARIRKAKLEPYME